MKRIKNIYSYCSVTGKVDTHKITYQRFGSLVRECGISGEVVRESELDTPGEPFPKGRYYTTRLGAVEGFLMRGRARLQELFGPGERREELDPDVQGWRAAIDVALVAKFAEEQALKKRSKKS